MEKIPSLSKEYLHVPVGGPSNLTSFGVEMAVLPEGQDPVTGDWKTASWDAATGDAILLIGPGGGAVTLTKGVTYEVWVRITASPEQPILRPGFIHAT